MRSIEGEEDGQSGKLGQLGGQPVHPSFRLQASLLRSPCYELLYSWFVGNVAKDVAYQHECRRDRVAYVANHDIDDNSSVFYSPIEKINLDAVQ